MKKINIKEQIFIPFLLALMIYFFIPSEIYFANIQEMTFPYGELLKGTLPDLLLLYFGLLIISFLLLYFNDKLYKIFTALIISVIFIFFINNFFFQVHVVLDGTEKIKQLSFNSIINIIVNIAALIFTFFIAFKKKNIKALYPAVYIILVVQAGIYTYSYVNNYSEINKISANNKLEEKNIDKYNILQLSKEQNIIYVVLDSFDHEILTNIIKENKLDIADDFKDFIYYSNYSSIYPYTRPSGIAQFTNEIYQNQMPFKEFQMSVFSSGKSTFEQLKNQGWDNIIYPSNNIYAPNIELYSNITDGSKDMRQLHSIIDITYYKITPLMFKNMVRGMQHYSKDNWDFVFLNILNNQIKENNNKTFLLAHLIGAHAPYVVNENLEMSAESSQQKQAVASLKLMKMFIDKLKKEGFYDNSLIVITADHGARALRSHPILFIKPYNSKSDKLVTDNKALSHHSMNKILLNYAGDKTYNINLLPDEKNRVFYTYSSGGFLGNLYLPPMTEYIVPENVSDYDKYVLASIMNTEPVGLLPVKYTLQKDTADLPKGMFDKTWIRGGQSADGLYGSGKVNIKIKDSNAVVFKSEIQNMNPTPVLMTIFEKDKLLYKTTLNGNSVKHIETTLLLDELAQISFYNNVLIKNIEIEQAEKYTHLNNINSNKTALSDDLYDNKSGMIVKLNADIIFKDKVPVKDRSIVLKYDNITISRYTVYDKNSSYYAIIPENLIKKHKNGLIEITADDRLIKQINIKSASIISGKGYADIFKLLQETNRVIPTNQLPEITYMQGWHNTENHGRWGGQDNYLYLPIPENISAGMVLNIYGHALVNMSKQQGVSFYSNNKLLYKTDINEQKNKKFTIKLNKEMIDNGFILLNIKTNYSDRPKNGDMRVLGFGLTGIEFKTSDKADYSIRDISLMGVDGLYSPEETLVWADKDFIIRIPNKDIPKQSESIVVEIDGRFYFNKEREAQYVEVYHNNHLLKKFTAQNDNIKTYSVKLDLQNIDNDIELTFKTKYACSPADNGENSDTRKLAFAVSGLRIYKPEIFSQGEYLVENIDNSSFKSNWYSKEPGLIWSSNDAVLSLPLSKELQAQENILIDIKGRLYFNKNNDIQTLGIYADDNLLKEYEVINNNNDLYTVKIPKKYLSDILNLTIKTKYNSSPKLDGRGDDGRLLGFALTGINIRNDNSTENVTQNEIKHGVQDISLMGVKGWYHAEQELIWSRKNAELFIPVIKADNAASINITLKGQSFIDAAKQQKLSIYYKDKKVKEYIVDNNSVYDYSFTIDKDKNMDYIHLKIESGYEEQPKNTGESLDDRPLAFGIREIIVK